MNPSACATCGAWLSGRVRHLFDDRAYCENHCPQCLPALRPAEAQRVAMVKRGCRRGTPRAWALRGVGS